MYYSKRKMHFFKRWIIVAYDLQALCTMKCIWQQKTHPYTSAQSVPCFLTLIKKQAKAKLCYSLDSVIRSDSYRCLATGCGEDIAESLSASCGVCITPKHTVIADKI